MKKYLFLFAASIMILSCLLGKTLVTASGEERESGYDRYYTNIEDVYKRQIRRRSTNKAESSIRKVWGFFLYWETRHFWKGPGLSCLQTVQKFLSDQETAGMAM